MLEGRVLFIDGEAMVIDKPAGLAVDRPRVPAPSIADLADELRFGFAREPAAVHRLDRDTSGCLLLARNPKALRRLGQAFEQGMVEKVYLAVLDGIPDAEAGTVDLALGKVSSRDDGWRVVPDRRGKPAVTHWRRIATEGGRALVEFRPETGRTHQIRVHAAQGIGLPILGDPVYGRAGAAMRLHAARLRVPRDGKPAIEATAPLPPAFGTFADPFAHAGDGQA